MKIDLKRLEKISEEWSKIESSFKISVYNTPLNKDIEKDKFLKSYYSGVYYNPIFKYRPYPGYRTKQIKDFLANLEPNTCLLENIYFAKARNKLLSLESMRTHDPDIITAMSISCYGFPDTNLVSQATGILNAKDEQYVDQRSNTSLDQLSSDDVALVINNIIKSIGLQQWKALTVKHSNSKIAVNRIDKVVKINERYRFTVDEVNRLLLHEIGVHLFRYENGRRQPIGLFEQGFVDYLSTEEGLAVITEEKSGLLSTSTLKKYCGRVLAARLSINSSFYEVFKQLSKRFDVDLSFNITTRAKRGFEYTGEPGVHTKDMVYLKGYLMLREYLEKYPDRFDKLFLGKFGVSDMDLIDELYKDKILSSPIFLPSALESYLLS